MIGALMFPVRPKGSQCTGSEHFSDCEIPFCSRSRMVSVLWQKKAQNKAFKQSAKKKKKKGLKKKKKNAGSIPVNFFFFCAFSKTLYREWWAALRPGVARMGAR